MEDGEGTYDTGCGDVEYDGLVGGEVRDVEALYEEALWGSAICDGRGD